MKTSAHDITPMRGLDPHQNKEALFNRVVAGRPNAAAAQKRAPHRSWKPRRTEAKTMSHTAARTSRTTLRLTALRRNVACPTRQATRIPTHGLLIRFITSLRGHHGKRTMQRYTAVLDVLLQHLTARGVAAVELSNAEPAGHGVLGLDALLTELGELVADEHCEDAPIKRADRVGRFLVRSLMCWLRDQRRARPPRAPRRRSRSARLTALRLRLDSPSAWQVNPALKRAA